jgi:hypothetical protein
MARWTVLSRATDQHGETTTWLVEPKEADTPELQGDDPQTTSDDP